MLPEWRVNQMRAGLRDGALADFRRRRRTATRSDART